MKASALFHSCMLVLLLSGIVMSAFSLVGAYFGTGDFLDNLFADRGSEQIGMGIKGLQLFHYLIGGIAVSTLSAVLLAVGKKENPFDSISSDSLSQSKPAEMPIGMMKEIEDAMNTVARTEGDSNLVEEIAVFKNSRSRKVGSRPSPASEKINVKSDSLIIGATVLLKNEQEMSESAEQHVE